MRHIILYLIVFIFYQYHSWYTFFITSFMCHFYNAMLIFFFLGNPINTTLINENGTTLPICSHTRQSEQSRIHICSHTQCDPWRWKRRHVKRILLRPPKVGHHIFENRQSPRGLPRLEVYITSDESLRRFLLYDT